MRALKTILIIVVAIIVLILILSMIGDKSYRVERSTMIKAPAELVYPYVSSLKNMEAWGPWKEEDPNMAVTFEGEDGKVGAKSMWKGETSTGSQELVLLEPNKSVRTKLVFTEPMTSEQAGTFDLQSMGDSTKITWGMEGENNWMGRVMSVFMNMDKMVGPMFEKGLSNLKELAEADAAMDMKTAGTYVVESGDRPAMLYIGRRSDPKLPWDQIAKFYGDNLKPTWDAVTAAGVQLAGVPTGIYFDWNTEDKTTDMMAALPVPADARGKVKGSVEYEVPAGKAYWTTYTGGYSGMMPAHDAVDAKLTADGMGIADVVIEEYVTDPGSEPDSTKWVTRIIYMAKPAEQAMK